MLYHFRGLIDLTVEYRSILSASNQPSVNVGVDAVTPAPVYGSAMRTGQSHNQALYHTIERRQPEKRGKVPELQFGPPQLGNPEPKSSERGLSFAQRLYASALSNKNSIQPSSNIPVTPMVSSSSALPTGILHCQLDTSLDNLRSFNPSDLYHGHIAMQGFLSRVPEASSARRSSLNTLPAARLSYSTVHRTSSSSSQISILKSEAGNPRQVPYSFQSVSMEVQPSRSAVLDTQALGPLEVSAGTHQGFHSPAVVGETIPSPLLQQFLNLPSPSPPPFERHGALSSLPEEFVADITSVITRLPVPVTHEDSLPECSFHLPSEVNHEEIPSYSLVDEQLPPPAFDDLRICY